MAKYFEIPTQERTNVERITKVGDDFRIDTSEETLRAKHVIWAAGEFQYPRLSSVDGGELCQHTATIPSYEKLAAYMAVHGLKEGAVSWEEYVSDPADVSESDWVTHIYFLIGE